MAPAATPTFDGWPVTPANPNGTLIESMETTVSSLPPLQFPAWPRRFHRLGGEVEVKLPEALARSKNVPGRSTAMAVTGPLHIFVGTPCLRPQLREGRILGRG